MEEKRTRKQQAEETRQHIFDVALQMLQEKEFEEITIRDIVKGAGVSIGAFYNYFPTKLDVYYETYVIADRYFETEVAPKMTRESAADRIILFFNEYAKYSETLTGLKLTKLLYNSGNNCFNRTADYGMMRILREEVLRGMKSGELLAFDKEGIEKESRRIASFLMIAARGLVYNWCTKNGSYDLTPEMNRYIRVLLRTCIAVRS